MGEDLSLARPPWTKHPSDSGQGVREVSHQTPSFCGPEELRAGSLPEGDRSVETKLKGSLRPQVSVSNLHHLACQR